MIQEKRLKKLVDKSVESWRNQKVWQTNLHLKLAIHTILILFLTFPIKCNRTIDMVTTIGLGSAGTSENIHARTMSSSSALKTLWICARGEHGRGIMQAVAGWGDAFLSSSCFQWGVGFTLQGFAFTLSPCLKTNPICIDAGPLLRVGVGFTLRRTLGSVYNPNWSASNNLNPIGLRLESVLLQTILDLNQSCFNWTWLYHSWDFDIRKCFISITSWAVLPRRKWIPRSHWFAIAGVLCLKRWRYPARLT